MMNGFLRFTLVAAVFAGGVAAHPHPGAQVWAAAQADLSGTWKLVVLAFGDDEFAIVKIQQEAGKTTASMVNAQSAVLGNAEIERVSVTGADLELTISGPGGPHRFEGTVAEDNPGRGSILGSFTFRGEVYPARLERTDAPRVAELKQSPAIRKYLEASREADPKAKVQKLRDAIHGNNGSPVNHLFYTELLGAARAAELSPKEVSELVEDWIAQAKSYGPRWLSEVRYKAARTLGASAPFSELGLALAQEAERSLGETATTERRAELARLLARAAELAGNADLARDAKARSDALEAQLDEEYHKKVPPFSPVAFRGRKDPTATSVVLMELFTGAQCPPCVAADVGFDALLKTYQPTEFVGLQYHLHIPGPDPLTNPDSMARQNYYGDQVRGTPSTFFNGQSAAGGGGPMAFAEQKYNEYREIIDRQLDSARGADIQVMASRAADLIEIQAEATLKTKPGTQPADAPGDRKNGPKDGDNEKSASRPAPRLRLALTEDTVRYVGRNQLRFHHQVVRDFPGGVDGQEFTDGQARIAVKVDLAELRKELEDYLSDFAKRIPFPTPLPEIGLEDLHVVAFIQDDADKKVLHAVSVPVTRLNP